MFSRSSHSTRETNFHIHAQPNVKGIFCMWHNLEALSLHVCKIASWMVTGCGEGAEVVKELKREISEIKYPCLLVSST